MIDLDFEGTPSLDELFTPLDDGEYLFIVTDAKVNKSKDVDKKPSLLVRLTSVEDASKNVLQNFYLDMTSDISKAYLKDFLEKVYGGDEITGPISLDPKDLIGRNIIAMVTVVPRNDLPDKMQNKVSYFTAAI